MRRWSSLLQICFKLTKHIICISIICIFFNCFIVKANNAFTISFNNPLDGNTYNTFLSEDGKYYLYLPYGTSISQITLTCSLNISSVNGAELVGDREVIVDNNILTLKDEFENEYTIEIRVSDIASCNISLREVSLADINSNGKDKKYSGNNVYLFYCNDKVESYDNVEIKGRGNYTWNLSKKSYQIKLNKKADIFGLGKGKKWILLPNYTDNSMVRNKLAYDLAKNIDLQFAIDSKAIDLWIDGEYIGNYLLTEKIQVADNRIELKDDLGVVAELDNLYYSNEDLYSMSDINGTHFVLKDSFSDDLGAENSISAKAFEKLMKAINNFENALYGGEDWKTVSSYIDVDSFVKMYFLQELSEDSDGCRSSFFLYKDGNSDVIHLGPAWDYDIAFGNFAIEQRGGNPNLDYIENISNYMSVSSNVFKQLLTYKEFRKKVVSYYNSGIKDAFASADKMIDDYYNLLAGSAEMNFKKWDRLGKTALFSGGHTNKETYEEEINYLKTWLSERIHYLDNRYAIDYISGDDSDFDYYYLGMPYVVGEYEIDKSHVFINQVYGGKNNGAYASHSFIELYNPLNEDVDLSGWSLQYRSSADGDDSTAWRKLDLTGTIPSYCSYLVRCLNINNPGEGSVVIEKYDQEWNQVINNKGCSVVLVANNKLISTNSTVFDNETGKPVLNDYVDMVGVSGNDTKKEEDVINEASQYYEKASSQIQSKKIGIRRKNLTDTDDNTVDGDFEAVDYSFGNADYIAYIAPRCSTDGPWTYNEATVPRFTTTFVNFAGGGSNQEEYTYNSCVIRPEDPVRTGYTFDNWYMDAACTSEYSFDYKPTSDITLYGGWTINQYTLSFESNGGSEVESKVYDYNVQVEIPEEPEKEGYSFGGWYTDIECTMPYEFGKMPARDVKVYAKWNINTYTLSYDTNGGSEIDSVDYMYGAEVLETETFPVKEGYTFSGWYADKKCTTEYEFTTMPAKNVTVYAKWTDNSYELSFESNGGSEVACKNYSYGEETVYPEEPVKEGYTFVGWYSDKEFTKEYVFDTMPARDVKVYARWSINIYTIHFVTNGGSNLKDTTAEYASNISNINSKHIPVKDGYIFTGWYFDRRLTSLNEFKTMPANDLTVYAGWTPVKSQVSFDTSGGSIVNEITVTYGEEVELAEPVKEGAIFTGWYVDDACTVPYDPDKVYEDKVTLHAGWKTKEYTVKWVDFDGKLIKSEKVKYGKDGTAPADPERTGYTFIGWSSKADNVVSNMTIEALYEKITIVLSADYSISDDAPYSVTLDGNNVSVSEITLFTKKYKKAQFSAKVIGSTLPVKWSSSDKSIATVSKYGKVKVKKAGTVYVTAACGGAETVCMVVVKKADIGLVVSAKGTSNKSIKGSSIKLNNGRKYKLRVTALPKGKVTYKIGNRKIIRVSTTKKDNVLQIEALKKGSTILTIKANGIKRKIKVRVK